MTLIKYKVEELDRLMSLNVNQNIAFRGNETVQTAKPQQKSAATNPIEKTQTTEKKYKKGLSTGTWVGLGALATVAIAGIAIVATHGKNSKFIKDLPEKLDFKEAQTMEEAISFAKEQLGVHINVKNDLNLTNFINKCFVDIVNKTKGKSVLPKYVKINNTLVSEDNIEVGAMMQFDGTLTLGNLYLKLSEIAQKQHKTILKLIDENKDLTDCVRSIYHEIGHANHFANCKDASKMMRISELKASNIKDLSYTEDFLKEIKGNKKIEEYFKYNNKYKFDDNKEATIYALSSPAEFIAETFNNMLTTGKEAPEDVMKIYYKYGAPKINL